MNQNTNNTNRNTNGPILHESDILETQYKIPVYAVIEHKIIDNATAFEYHCLLANKGYCWIDGCVRFEHLVREYYERKYMNELMTEKKKREARKKLVQQKDDINVNKHKKLKIKFKKLNRKKRNNKNIKS